MIFTGLLFVTSVLSGIVAYLQVGVSHQAANASQTAADASAAAVDLQDEQMRRNRLTEARQEWLQSQGLKQSQTQFQNTLGQMQAQTRAQVNAAVASQTGANAAQSAANTARDALVIGNRPWIKIDIGQTGPLVFLPDGSARIGLQEKMENVGSSVALRVFEWFDILPRGSIAINRQKQWCDANRFPQSTMSGEVMFPHDPVLYPSQEFVITKDHIVPHTEKGLEGKVAFMLVGCVTYRSSFEGPSVPSHETLFQYSIGKTNGPLMLPFVDPVGTHPDYILVRIPDGFTAD